jgi:hypothetical protein
MVNLFQLYSKGRQMAKATIIVEAQLSNVSEPKVYMQISIIRPWLWNTIL